MTSAAASSCLPSRGTVAVEMPELAATGDLVLRDGRLARLAGIRMLKPQAGALNALFDRGPSLAMDERAPRDRWGRMTVTLTREGVDLAHTLLKLGHAAVDPATVPGNCLNSYLEAERAARRAGAGAWPDHRPIDGSDSQAVSALAGAWAIVEGRIVSVGVTRRSAFLNFGARGQGSSVILSLSQWRQIEAKGWTQARLRGQIVTARGIVDGAVPPRLVVETAAAIDMVE